MPAPEVLDGWFTVAGEPATVLDVLDTSRAQVVAIFDSEAKDEWTAMRFRSGRKTTTGSYTTGPTSQFSAFRSYESLAVAALGENTLMRVASAVPSGEDDSGLDFEMSGPVVAPDGDAIIEIPLTRPEFDGRAGQHLADSAAMAGRWLASSDQGRAVIVIIDRRPEDASQFSAEQVRRYLAAVGVPLEVWCPDTKKIKKSDWGEMIRVSKLRQLDGTVKELNERLARQQLVWLEGAHLPQDIELGPQARADVVIVGR